MSDLLTEEADLHSSHSSSFFLSGSYPKATQRPGQGHKPSNLGISESRPPPEGGYSPPHPGVRPAPSQSCAFFVSVPSLCRATVSPLTFEKGNTVGRVSLGVAQLALITPFHSVDRRTVPRTCPLGSIWV